jgi:molecular chaperone GrpE
MTMTDDRDTGAGQRPASAAGADGAAENQQDGLEVAEPTGETQSPPMGDVLGVAGEQAAGGRDVEATPAGPAPDASMLDTMAAETMEQLESLQSEMASLNDRHLRLAAEFDNYRKRIDRERAELWSRAQAELVKTLLEALDDLQRVESIDVERATVETLHEGIRLVEKKLRRSLEVAGLESIDAEGEFFNPAIMEALMTLPAEHPEEDEVVADVFEKGYRFKDLLIRPARVRVKKYETD